jgi:outer membrane receptor for ferric coprogen and ferric-rhodotorulic acid
MRTPARLPVLGLSLVALLAAAASSGADDQLVKLDPFQVVSDPRNSYEAQNITSLSGINQSLDNLPISAEIFNATRLADLGESDVVDLLNNYAAGVGQSFASSAGTGTQGGDRYGMSSYNIRGLPAGAIRRNGFLTANNLSEMFEADRVEIIDGPQSLLFGTNPGGGVINVVTKKAHFGENFSSPQFRIDSFGSKRAQFDGNYSTEIAGHGVAVRIAALEDRAYFFRTIAERDTKAIYADLAVQIYQPMHTVLRFTAEEINGHMYETTPQVKVTGAPTLFPNNSVLSVLLATNAGAVAQIDNGFISRKTVDTLAGYAATTIRRHQYYEATLSSDITPWLKGEFVASQSPVLTLRDSPSATTALSAPLTNGNPLNTWAIAYRPAGIKQHQINEGMRALLTADVPVGNFLTNSIVLGSALTDNPGYQISQNYYQVDSSGNFVVNAATATNADSGRTLIPIQWVDVQNNQRGYTTSFQNNYTINGVTYARDFAKYPNPALAAVGNPLGYNGGSSGVSLTNQISRSIFGTLSSTWFKTVDTLAGVRVDELAIEQKATGAQVLGSGVTGNLGLVWHFSKPVALYGGYSSNFSPGSFNFASNLTGGLLPNGRGTGREGGLKFNALHDQLTGSITYYTATASNNSAVLAAGVQTATDPNGINGRYYTTFANPSITYNSRSKGVNLTIAAQPTKNWRIDFGYNLAMGTLGNAIYVPFLYNDQFNATSAGGVTIGKGGAALLVPLATTTPVAITYAGSVATEPLTLTILKNGDANGNYKAQLDPNTGQILNASALGLTLPGVGTGAVGLPISQHQLGFTPPLGASLLAQAGGDTTQGYPKNMFTISNVYKFDRGWAKGISLGFNANISRDMALYYYVDAARGSVRVLKYAPPSTLINLIAAYDFNLSRRVRFKSQVNVNNVFDDRAYALYPNVASGIYDNALMRNNPITTVWTNTITF